jgi:hypothetical protein
MNYVIYVTVIANNSYFLKVHQPFKDEAQTALFKDPARAAQ